MTEKHKSKVILTFKTKGARTKKKITTDIKKITRRKILKIDFVYYRKRRGR